MHALAITLLSALALALMFVPLERAFRARAQPIVRAQLGLDALFFAGQYLVWNALSIAAIAALHRAYAQGAVLPTRDLPAAVQIILGVALGDLSMYAFHVACHRVPWLWRFHAVHHSTEQLDWLAAHREHPLDGFFTQLAMNLPALLLGLSFELFAPVIVFRSLWAIVVHSNTRLPLGPLKWILGAPELHRHHHHATTERVMNFANLAPWVDRLFGTHHDPSTEAYPLGVPGWSLPSRAGLGTYLRLLWPPAASGENAPASPISNGARGFS